ncbi:MAG: hypothetical protein O7G87_15475, partial [bacterium]|nr:hypothetical protein [bacterium]
RLPCDGQSIMGLIDRTDTENRIAFSEAHEAVGTPCFMARKGPYKYIHVHGYDTQLFDLQADPGEWHNLSGSQNHTDLETELRSAILNTFDPDAIADANLDSLYRRQCINQAMQTNGTSWAHNPGFDPNKNAQAQYLS